MSTAKSNLLHLKKLYLARVPNITGVPNKNLFLMASENFIIGFRVSYNMQEVCSGEGHVRRRENILEPVEGQGILKKEVALNNRLSVLLLVCRRHSKGLLVQEKK